MKWWHFSHPTTFILSCFKDLHVPSGTGVYILILFHMPIRDIVYTVYGKWQMTNGIGYRYATRWLCPPSPQALYIQLQSATQETLRVPVEPGPHQICIINEIEFGVFFFSTSDQIFDN